MTSSLSEAALTDLTGSLRDANEEFSRHYPGETGRRQPVHTVYGGAHLFKSDTAKRLGSQAPIQSHAGSFRHTARNIGRRN